MNAAPLLTTERLVLRAHQADDYEPLHRNWSAPEVYHFISGKPSTREQSWQRLMRYCGAWPLLGYGFWVVTDKATGTFMGEVGFCDFHRDCDPPLPAGPEMGWVLGSEWQGKGYGREAVHAALNWADTVLKPQSIFCIISPENAASVAIANGAGFKPSHKATYNGDVINVMVRKL